MNIKTVKGHGNYKCPECHNHSILYYYSMDKESSMGMCKKCLCIFKIKYDGFWENDK